MTVPASPAHHEYIGNSSSTSFVYSFSTDVASEIEVRIDGIIKTNDVDYNLTGVGTQSGGTVVFTSAPLTGTVVSIRRVVAQEQLLTLVPNSALPAASLEGRLDQIVKMVQGVYEELSRRPRLDVGTKAILRDLEFPTGISSRLIGWDLAGTGLTTYPISGVINSANFDTVANYNDSLNLAVDSIAGGNSFLLVDRPVTLTAGVVVPANLVLFFTPAGSIDLDGHDLEINSSFHADRHQIFSGSGDVTFPNRHTVVFPEWWGADPTGVTAANEVPFAKALASLTNGGTLLGIGAWGTYKFGATIGEIRTSNITIDMQGALLQSSLVFNLADFNGDSGVDGDYSEELENCTFKNVRIGSANDSNNGLSPPEFTYVRHGLIENVIVRGEQNGFNIQACNHVTVKHCSMLGQRNEQIGFFFILSNDCLMEDCYYDGDDAPLHGLGVQIKGGRNNKIKNCTFRRLAYNGVATHRFCVYVRGFDPYSNVAPASFSYPYPDIGYGAPDDRRQSINTVIEGCYVEDSPTMGAFRVVESVGTRIVNCAAHNVRTGVTILRGASPAASNERDVIVENCVFTDIGTTEAVGAAATAIFVESSNADPIPGVQIRNNIIRNCSGVGISIEYTQDLVMDGNCVYDTCIDLDPMTDRRSGIDVILSDIRPRILNNTVTDTRTGASRTIDVGIFVGASTVSPIVAGNIIHNCLEYQLQSWVVGDYSNNYPGEGYGITSVATDVDDILRFAMMAGQTAWIEVDAVAQQGNTHRAYYKIGGLFHNNAGTITQVSTDKKPVWAAGLTATLSAITQLTNNSGGTANDTVAAITSVDVAGAGTAAEHLTTRDAVADLAAKEIALITEHGKHITQQTAMIAAEAPVESNTAWTGIRFSILSEQVRVIVTPGVAVDMTWILKGRCIVVSG